MRLLFLQVERGNLFSLHDAAAAATYYMLKIGRDNHQKHRTFHFLQVSAFKTLFVMKEREKRERGSHVDEGR